MTGELLVSYWLPYEAEKKSHFHWSHVEVLVSSWLPNVTCRKTYFIGRNVVSYLFTRARRRQCFLLVTGRKGMVVSYWLLDTAGGKPHFLFRHEQGFPIGSPGVA